MPHLLDLLLTLEVMVAWPLVEHLYNWPRWRSAIAAGRPGARAGAYRNIMLNEWGRVALVAVAWWGLHRGQPFPGFGAPRLIPFALALVAGLGLAALFFEQARRIAGASLERQQRLVARISAPVRPILPHTPREAPVFAALAVTAGFCEELLFRGYSFHVLAAAGLGPWGALLVSSVGFGLGHSYQGRAGIVRSGLAGVFFVGLFLLTRSLWPGILIHAVVDLGALSVYPALRRVAELPGGEPATGVAA